MEQLTLFNLSDEYLSEQVFICPYCLELWIDYFNVIPRIIEREHRLWVNWKCKHCHLTCSVRRYYSDRIKKVVLLTSPHSAEKARAKQRGLKLGFSRIINYGKTL